MKYIWISVTLKICICHYGFSTGQIIDIVHNRWHSTLESYFLSIPLKERLNVKGVISDAYKAYLTMPEEFFPNAITILDSFHVVKVIISQMNAYIYKVMKKYKKRDEQRLKEKITIRTVMISL